MVKCSICGESGHNKNNKIFHPVKSDILQTIMNMNETVNDNSIIHTTPPTNVITSPWVYAIKSPYMIEIDTSKSLE